MNKGTYGHPGGIFHAELHAVFTYLCFSWYFPTLSVILALVDGIIHYHVDWLKVKINNRYGWTVEQPQYWALFGFDQFIHALTYIIMVFVAFKEFYYA